MSSYSSIVVDKFDVQSDNVKVTDKHIISTYEYKTTKIEKQGEKLVVKPTSQKYEFRVTRKAPKMGLMLVGWGGNNGSTVTAGVIANKNKLSWETKEGVKKANWFGSMTQSSTVRLGHYEGSEVYTPFKNLLPLVDPSSITLGGWDISKLSLQDAMKRAKVVDIDLQKQLREYGMDEMIPLPAIFDQNFVAGNQADRADNTIQGTKQEQMEKIRKDIREFKERTKVDKIIILWTANTERYAQVKEGLNTTSEELLNSIKNNEAEIAPSTLYAVAAIFEGVSFINGSPQNTFVPGCIELAISKNVLIGGDDFKSGQTKMKSVLVDFFTGAGLKPTSIVSYNHLGNNDGKNLDEPKCFRSKEISKADVVTDIINNTRGVLYEENEKVDHCIVIKYIPSVGDSKRALDEYTNEIFMGGKNTIVMHNTCEDSLLAAPIIIDMAIVAELTTRIEIREIKEGVETEFKGMHPIAVLLSYFSKAPLVPPKTPCINALSKQRAMLENVFRACIGLQPENNMLLEFKTNF